MKRTERSAGFLGLLLLAAFFAPYVVKLQQFDIGLILLLGLALAGYDYFKSES